MTVTRFELTNEWRLAAPIDRVWDLIAATEQWPIWWRAVERVDQLHAGDAIGLGAVHRMHWKTALPYALCFDVETMRVEPLKLIEGRASGELDGSGLWTFVETPQGTTVRYLWRVVSPRHGCASWRRYSGPVSRGTITR